MIQIKKMVYIFFIVLGIALFIHGNIGLSYGQTPLNTMMNTNLQTGLLNTTEPVYQAITGKFLATKEISINPFPVTEEYFFEDAIMKNIGKVVNNMTFTNTYLSNGLIQAKGNGTITTKDGQTIDWISSDIGVNNNKGPVYIGIILFKNATGEKLSFLNNTAGVYKESPEIKRTMWLIK